VDPVDGRSLVRTGNACGRKPRAGKGAAAPDQRPVDHAAGKRTRCPADDRTDRPEDAAERGTRRLEKNRGHGKTPRSDPGKSAGPVRIVIACENSKAEAAGA